MITFIHGDNIAESRKLLISYKSVAGDKDIREINGTTVSENDLMQALESHSLFGNETLVIVERLIETHSRKPKQLEKFINIITKEKSTECILWESKEVTSSTLKRFTPAPKVVLCKTPTIIFDFLDSVRPANGSRLAAILEKAVEKGETEMIRVLLIRRLRQLIMLKDAVALPIPSWQLSRLTTQANSFTMKQLIALYNYLYISDRKLKNGFTGLNTEYQLIQFVSIVQTL